jgi:hypothetical protein
VDDDGFCVRDVMKREAFAYHDCDGGGGDGDEDGDVTTKSRVRSLIEIEHGPH